MILKHLIIAALCLALPLQAASQSHRDQAPQDQSQKTIMDEALDRYETICDESIAIQKEKTRARRLQELSEHLEELRALMQGISVEMTPAQQRRYNSIRRRYDYFYLYDKEIPPVMELAELATPGAIPLQTTGERDAIVVPSQEEVKTRMKPFITLSAGYPPFNAGLSVGLFRLKWGAYAKVNSAFDWKKEAYACKSDGSTSTGNIWTTGRRFDGYDAFSAGILWRPFYLGAIRFGAGYGSYRLYWEDFKTRRVKVEDKSANGLLLDAGMVFISGRWHFDAGVQMLALRKILPQAGVGISF